MVVLSLASLQSKAAAVQSAGAEVIAAVVLTSLRLRADWRKFFR